MHSMTAAEYAELCASKRREWQAFLRMLYGKQLDEPTTLPLPK